MKASPHDRGGASGAPAARFLSRRFSALVCLLLSVSFSPFFSALFHRSSGFRPCVRPPCRGASLGSVPPSPGGDSSPFRTGPDRSRGGRAPFKGFISLRKSALRDAAAHGSRPAEALRRLDPAGGSRRRRFASGSRACPSGALEPGCPLSRPECPPGLPELEGEKLAVAPAPRLPGPGGRPARSGPLLLPGHGASESTASAALDPPGPRLSGVPRPLPAVLPAPPPPFPPEPKPPPRPQPGSPGVSLASRSLARPSGPAPRFSPRPFPLPSPQPFPSPSGSAPSVRSPRHHLRRRALAQGPGLGPGRREVPEPARVPEGLWEEAVLNPKAREE